MMIKLFPLFLLAVVAGVEGLSLNKDSNSIIEVSIDCGASVSENSPVLKILTDVDITAVAKCKNGDQSFTSTDSVHYILPATLTSSVELCQLNEKKASDNYDITVEVHYGEADGLILTKSKRVTVVCTYSDYGKDDSPQHSISNGPQAHIEKQTLVGTSVPASDIKLNIQTVDNQDAVGAIAFDRRYSLFGSYTGAVNNVGLKPVSCYAVSDDGQESYAVLTAGCGDGFIFDRTDGFITTGKTFRSPYFFAFNLANSGNLAFNCNVTLCTDCDGTSCETDCGSDRYAITNGQLDGCKGNNKYEDTCRYICDVNHDKEGDGISTCGADGIWTVPPIVCTPKDCGPPPDGTASTGSANDGTTITKEATYSCNTGYEKLDGNAKISCLNTGNWDTENILICQGVDCGPLPDGPGSIPVDNTISTRYPSTATYTCKPDHESVRGSETMGCLATQNWDVSNPLVCACTAKLDVVLVIDGSGSVGAPNFNKMLNALSESMDRFKITPSTIHVGAVVFSTVVKAILPFSSDPESIKTNIVSITYPGGSTYTAIAIDAAQRMLTNGGRPDAKKIMIVLADGGSSDDPESSGRAATSAGTSVYTIGITKADMDEMTGTASSPDMAVYAETFNDIPDQLGEILNDLC